MEDVEPAIPVVQLCTVVDGGNCQSQDDCTGILAGMMRGIVVHYTFHKGCTKDIDNVLSNSLIHIFA